MIVIYQELDLDQMIVERVTPKLDTNFLSAMEFVAVLEDKNPDLDRLEEEEFADVTELNTIEDENVVSIVCAEVENKVKAY